MRFWMSDLIVSNINCFQTQKQLTILNNIGVLPKNVFIDLRARNFVHATTSLGARCAHARHHARSLLSPVMHFNFLNSEERHNLYLNFSFFWMLISIFSLILFTRTSSMSLVFLFIFFHPKYGLVFM